jgi:NAD+ synthetase
MSNIDYKEIFETLVQKTAYYIVSNGLKSMVLGISGGIDSTVCAAICHEVQTSIGIPLIGRSLPTGFNKEGETTTADLVGKAFCNDYKVCPIQEIYEDFILHIRDCEMPLGIRSGSDYQTPVANGNIQARLRMIHLYNLASINKGLVIDTDNLTENNLGYFTIHGDVGDLNPIGGLWKTEVFGLAKYLVDFYTNRSKIYSDCSRSEEDIKKADAITRSLALIPTAGLGITNSDLEELEADSYEQVDTILKSLIKWVEGNYQESFFHEVEESLKTWMSETKNIPELKDIPEKIIESVSKRFVNSSYKRKHLPIKIKI